MIGIYVSDITPRIDYAFRLVFETILGKEITFFTKTEDYNKSGGVKINYSDDQTVAGFFLKPHGLLHDAHLQHFEPETSLWEGCKIFFLVTDSFLPFDLFAASFYLVTRYEEYLSGKRDSHQRFMAGYSIAVKHLFLEKPVVNIWAWKMAELLSRETGEVFQKKPFTYLPTIDIDNAWAYQHKGFIRSTGSTLKDLLKGRIKSAMKRIRVYWHLEKDPYDNYDFLLTTLDTYRFKPITFFLMQNKGKHDRAISHHNLFFRSLISRMAKTGEVGIHPSYRSNKAQSLLSTEIKRLHSVVNRPIKYSRQHYLKLSLPFTYRRLMNEGIEADFSMGYPTRPGFRAGIATPFPFFDLLANTTTSLTIYPFQVMDVTLLNYRRMEATDALKRIIELLHETANVGGTFVSLWHNESLSDEGLWLGWRNVYTEMTREAAKIRDEYNN